MNPLLDTSKLTDDEITERLNKANAYLYNQIQLGHNPTVFSIKEIIESLEAERRKRYEKMSEDEYKRKNPNHDKPIELGKLDE